MPRINCSIAPLLAVIAALASGSVLAQSQGRLTEKPAPLAPSAMRSVPAETKAASHVDPHWKVPRTSWGHPSLEGVWSIDDMRSVPMNRPKNMGPRESLTEDEFLNRAGDDEGERNFTVNVGTFLQHEAGVRTFGYSSLIVDPPTGQMPELTANGKALAAARTKGTYGPGPFDDFEDFSLYDRCITRGALSSLQAAIYGNGLVITQNPDSVAITYEMIHDTRIIALDGRAHIDDGVRQYMGNARGHWERDTLVVETTNFTAKTGGLGGAPSSEQLKLTERFTRVDPQMIEYVATIDDPVIYTAPFTVRLMITTQPNYEVLEYSCHEGNGAVAHALSGERVYEQQVAEAKAKGLPIPRRAVEHTAIRNGPEEGVHLFNINAGE